MSLMTANVPDKVAIVTGAGTGIGRAVALALLGGGYCVVLAGRRADVLNAVAAQVAVPERVLVVPTDVSQEASVVALFDAALERFGRVDVLFNNAGTGAPAVPLEDLSLAQWQSVIDVNLTGAFNGARAAASVLRENGWGAIVNITSINGMRGKFGQCNYAASKAGLIGLTKSLARELARFNVTVNAVAPGLINTPATAKLPAEVQAQSVKEILLGRIGQPQDVADCVAFLCSDEARFITGEVIRVDGGQYI